MIILQGGLLPVTSGVIALINGRKWMGYCGYFTLLTGVITPFITMTLWGLWGAHLVDGFQRIQRWGARQVCVMRTFCPWHVYTMGPQNLHCLRVFLVDNVVFQALAKFQLRDFKYTRQALHCDRRASDLWIRGSDEPQQLCGGTHRHSSYLVKPQDTDIWNITPTLLWSTPTHVRELNSSKKILKVEDFEQARG